MCLIQRKSLCANQNPSEAQNCIVFTISKLNLKSSVMFLQVNFDLPLITCETCFPEDKTATSTFFSKNHNYDSRRECKMSHYNRQFRCMTNKLANALK